MSFSLACCKTSSSRDPLRSDRKCKFLNRLCVRLLVLLSRVYFRDSKGSSTVSVDTAWSAVFRQLVYLNLVGAKGYRNIDRCLT